MDYIYIFLYVRCCGTACVYFSFRWGPFVHSLGIVQWNSTRRDHPGNLGGVSGSGPVSFSRSSSKLSSLEGVWQPRKGEKEEREKRKLKKKLSCTERLKS